MPVVSHRGASMPPSPIRKLVPFAEAAKARGVNVFHLNIGQPDIETPPAILDAVRNAEIQVLEYSHSAGNESYRRKLVEYYQRNNINLTPEQIIVTTGGSEALSFGIQACLDPGDEIIIPEPFYANYNGFATSAGVNVVPIVSTIEDGFKLPEIDDFVRAITTRTKAIMICNPNNPTGYLYSAEEMENLRLICIKHDIFLFSDEAYREFCYDGREHISAMTLEGLEQHVILMDTISKRYSACGGRIGAFITRNKQVLETAMRFAQARLSPPSLGQILGEAAVDLPSDYYETVLKAYESRRDLLVERLNKIPGVFCPNPGGAFYAMASLPVANSERFCQWLLEEFSFEGNTIMMAPAAGFYATPGRGLNEVRLAYVLKMENINKAMDCLEHALVAYQKVQEEEAKAAQS